MGGTIKMEPGAESSYTVRQRPYGTLIEGSVPLQDFADLLLARVERSPDAVLHPGIARVMHATFAIADEPEKWLAEIEDTLRQTYPDDPESRWFYGPHTGVSSMVIFSVLATNDKLVRLALTELNHATSTPRDGDDWVRCHRVVKDLGWRERLPEVVSRHPHWEKLVAIWDELEAIYALWEAAPKDSRGEYEDKLYSLILETRGAAG